MSFITIGNSQVYYEEQGQGKPLLLLHDGLLDSTCWDFQFPVFAQTHHIIRYDRQAYGRSGIPTLPFSMLETLKSLLDHLHIAQAILLGGSFGGAIALHFALAYPQRVQKLVNV